jgi:hypothetical protein
MASSIAPAADPAALPTAQATIWAIDFGLRAGNTTKAESLATAFVAFMLPTSHGAVQQMVVDAKPGVYVLG